MNRFPQLVLAWCDGELTAEQGEELDALLRDPARQVEFQRLVTTHALLRGEFGRDPAAVAERARETLRRQPAALGSRVVATLRRRPRARTIPARRQALAWAMVAIAAIAIGVILSHGRSGAAPPPTAWIAGAGSRVDATTLGAGEAPLHGAETISAERGAQIRFADGSRLALAADSRLRLLPGVGTCLALDRGTLQAEVRPQPAGAPWRITTPHAQVTVRGTRFSLDVAARSTLRVESGTVEFTPAAGTPVLVHGGGSAEAGDAPSAEDKVMTAGEWVVGRADPDGGVAPDILTSLGGSGRNLLLQARPAPPWRLVPGHRLIVVLSGAAAAPVGARITLSSDAGVLLSCLLRPVGLRAADGTWTLVAELDQAVTATQVGITFATDDPAIRLRSLRAIPPR